MREYDFGRAIFRTPEPRKVKAMLREPGDDYRYNGMTYEASLRLGLAMCAAAAETGNWKNLPGHLTKLLQNMERHAA